MKKILFSAIAMSMLAGCASYYDYYAGGVKYVQDGKDCIYYVGEMGRNFSDDVRNMDKNKKIVYRNTQCADLYARDTATQPVHPERQVLTFADDYMPSCGCKSACNKPVVRRKYVVVPAM